MSHPHRWVDGTFEIRDGKIFRLAGNPSTDIEGVWVIPGMVDVHCHIGIGKQGETGGDAMLAQAHANRDAGVLLARDCGVIGDNSWINGRPDTLTVLRAGRHIAKHKRYIRGYAIETSDADLPAVMELQARAGTGWVKVVADWIDRSRGADSDLDPLWNTNALKEGVIAAHEAGARVTVHSFSEKAIPGLLEAGVDCIEHGTGMSKDEIEEASARGIAITPTLMQVALFPQFAKAGAVKYPVYSQTMTRLWKRHDETLQHFIDAGILLLPGTDAGGYQDHGSIGRELQLWESMGLPASQIIDLGTWRAREYLGVPGLGEGQPADLVMFSEDPREDISVLQRPMRVYYRGEQRIPQQ
ncbi:MAG: amidohydrolase family protein [Actinomycetaceae bacterium]|nr:amidohydrolase family protein [Actinomycetaceae bacterium]